MKIDKNGIFKKDGQKYKKIGDRALPFDKVDKHGQPIFKHEIVRRKDKKGKQVIDIKIQAFDLKVKQHNPK